MVRDAISYLGDKRGSTLTSIKHVLEKQYGCQSDQGNLKRTILRAVWSGKLKHCRKNFFVLNPGKRERGGPEGRAREF
nr:hypothetical protein BaRGS_022298 [Batillaria attramentaria]